MKYEQWKLQKFDLLPAAVFVMNALCLYYEKRGIYISLYIKQEGLNIDSKCEWNTAV